MHRHHNLFTALCHKPKIESTTIDKNLVSLLKHRFWKNKWEQWNQQVGSLKHMKKRGSEDKVLLKCWRHQKQDHQKQISSEDLKIIRSWENWSFKGCSNDLITSGIAEDWKNEATANSNGFEGIGCFFVGECWKRTIVRSVQPLSPLLWFVSAIRQEQQLCLHQCSSRLGMVLKLILLRTTTKLGKRSLVIWSSFKRLFLMCWQFTTSLSHLYIKEWRHAVKKGRIQFYKCQNSAEIVLHQKFTYNLLSKFIS